MVFFSKKKNKTGTINSPNNINNIPPSTGIAIGLIISLPIEVDHIMGKRANIVVAVVINKGRILLEPASIITLFNSNIELGFIFFISSLIYAIITTPLSTAIPKRAINPTHTATDKLNPENHSNIIPPAIEIGIADKIIKLFLSDLKLKNKISKLIKIERGTRI